MQIRLANLADLNACIALDDSFETEYVWQMEERNESGGIAIHFRQTRLPRPMRASGNIERDHLISHFQNGNPVFVAEEDGVCGWLLLMPWQTGQIVYLNDLVVAPTQRRRGIATKLMRAGIEWARQQPFRVILLDTATKNYPAICFYQKLGFTFSGFNDRLYPNRDIALYFALNLR
jgi:ribosomal protein S18 acetylase RimI-like enzyme